jgi:DNA-binding beta-propeller fold protein YncE
MAITLNPSRKARPAARGPRLALAALGLAAASLAGPSLSADAPKGYQVLATWRYPGGGLWDYLTVDPQARRLYLTRQDRVQVVDADTGKAVGEVAGQNRVHGVALAPKLNRGFISNGGDSTVAIFDLKTLKVIDRVAVTPNGGPDALVFDPASDRVFTANGKSRDSTVIDGSTGRVVGVVALPARAEGVVADGRGRLYMTLPRENVVVVVDAKTLQITAKWPVAPENTPHAVAIDAANHRLFVGCANREGPSKLVVLDTDSGKLLADLPIASDHDAIGFDPGTKTIYVSAGPDDGPGLLTIIAEQTPNSYAVLGDLQTAHGSGTLAVDPKTHHVFVDSGEIRKVVLKPDAPVPAVPYEVLDGTFHVQVVGKSR